MSAPPYGDALLSLGGVLDEVEDALALWETRDDTLPQPDIRRAAAGAMAGIDRAMTELHGIRERLAAEICASDAAAAARADALLRRGQDDDTEGTS
jgi:hypothetical protein